MQTSYQITYSKSHAKSCLRCASQVQISSGYENPQGYLDAAIYALESLQEYKQHPHYLRRKEELKGSSCQWVWMIAEAVKHEKCLSYFGAVIMPPVAAKEACKDMKLGNFYVQRRWNANKRSFEIAWD